MLHNTECGTVKNSSRSTAYSVSVHAKTQNESVRFRFSALATSQNMALRHALKRFMQAHPTGVVERVYVQQIKA